MSTYVNSNSVINILDSVVMLSIGLLSVAKLSVIMLSVLAPVNQPKRQPGKPCWKGKACTVDLHVLFGSDLLLLILPTFIYIYYKTNYLDEGINRTEPSI